ncbi:Putative regulator of phospholipase D Srf1 [Septoria linicola]|uniref:Regulator of phospholipase D Srf1 n=1 Tax=Septoria linicola TaxID=215465 RepID=A0A9Q9ASZ1_9PEZI|nr:putative regulator of phospholipase D Srf1 [Septoria linicola]USW50186.1 Putative regulator of phospholipase D Srf1 [Septoria linicola]
MPEMLQRSTLLTNQQQRQNQHLLPGASASHASTSTAGEIDPHQPSSLPPWIHVNDESAPFLEPAPVVPNTRHYKVPAKYQPGRKLDSYRDAEPGLLSAPIADHQVRWTPFMQSGPNPREHRNQRLIRSDSWMRENVPIFDRGWEEEDEINPDSKRPGGFQGLLFRGKWLISPERQERSVRLFWRLLLKNAFVPLVFRLTVLAFSCGALGVAATIMQAVGRVNDDNDINNQCAVRASTYMGIIVPAIAIPYIGYVTWDEYTSKPLGLRSVAAKTLLLLCDLYFIVFSASNLSLAFSALFDDSWACFETGNQYIGDVLVDIPKTCPNNPVICYKQKALSGILLITLVAWLLCFSISVLRVVEKLRLDY